MNKLLVIAVMPIGFECFLLNIAIRDEKYLLMQQCLSFNVPEQCCLDQQADDGQTGTGGKRKPISPGLRITGTDQSVDDGTGDQRTGHSEAEKKCAVEPGKQPSA